MGIATILEETVSTALEKGMLVSIQAHSAQVGFFIAFAMCLVLIKQFREISLGTSQVPYVEVIQTTVFQMLVLLIATTEGMYLDWIVNSAKALDYALVNAAGVGDSVGKVIDNAGDPIFEIGRSLLLRAFDTPLSSLVPLPDPTLMLLSAVVFITYIVFVVLASGVYLIQLSGQFVWLGLGPIGIACFAHPVTRQYGMNWINTLITFSVAKGLIALIGGVISNIMLQMAKDIGSGIESVELIGATLNMLVASAGLMLVFLNYNTLAGGLTSGSAISGVGREIYRAAMGAMSRGGASKPTSMPKSQGGGIKNNSNGGGDKIARR